MKIAFMHRVGPRSFAIFQEDDTCVVYEELEQKVETTISVHSDSAAPEGWFLLSAEATEMNIVQSLISDGAMEVQPEPLGGFLVARLIAVGERIAEPEAAD
jgi:hypothetical protein